MDEGVGAGGTIGGIALTNLAAMNALFMSIEFCRTKASPGGPAADWRRSLALCFAFLLMFFAARGALAWEQVEEIASQLSGYATSATPSVAVDEKGNATVLHLVPGAGQYEYSLVARQYDAAAAAWRPASVLGERTVSLSGFYGWSGIASLAGGDALAVWGRQRFNGNGEPVTAKDIVWSRYSAVAGQWSAPAVVVEQCECTAALAAGGQGEAWLLLSRYSEPKGTFAQRYSAASGWAAADRLYDQDSGGFAPMLKTNSRGDAILAWAGSTVADWYQARFFSAASQTWTPIDLAGQVLAGLSSQQIIDEWLTNQLRDLSIDDDGNVAFLGSKVVDDDNGTYNFTHDSYWVRRYSRASGTFGAVARFDVPGRSFNTTTTGQGRLASDARGNLLALVPETVEIPAGSAIGMRQYRFDAVSASWDAGRVVLPGEFKALQQDLASLCLTTDRAGNGLAVWVLDAYSPDGAEVRGTRFSVASGEWAAPTTIAARGTGTVVSPLGDLARGAAFAAAPNGEAVGAWSVVKGINNDTYAVYAARHVSWLHTTLADPLPIRAPGLATAKVRVRNPADVAQSITLRLIESEGVMYANDETNAGQWANDPAGVQKIVTLALGNFAAGEERTIDVPLHVSVIPAEATPDTPASASVLFEAETAGGSKVQSRLELSALHSDAAQGADFNRLVVSQVADVRPDADTGAAPTIAPPSEVNRAAATADALPDLDVLCRKPIARSPYPTPTESMLVSRYGDMWDHWIQKSFDNWSKEDKVIYCTLQRFGWDAKSRYLVIYLKALANSRPGKIGPMGWLQLRKAAVKFAYHLQQAKWTQSQGALYNMVKEVLGELDTINAMYLLNIMELHENYSAPLVEMLRDRFAAYSMDVGTFQQKVLYYGRDRIPLSGNGAWGPGYMPYESLVKVAIDHYQSKGYFYSRLYDKLLRFLPLAGGSTNVGDALKEVFRNPNVVDNEGGGPFPLRSSLSVNIYSPLMPLITDAQGRRAGIDLAGGELYDEIPGMVIEPGHPWVITLPAETGTLDIRYATAYPYAFGVDVQGIAGGVVTSSLSFSGTAQQGEQRRQTLNVSASPSHVGISQGAGIVVSEELTVEKNGDGTVDSTPAGIACGSTCNVQFDAGSSITLNATPAQGKRFAGWGGACSGTASACTLTMDAGKRVTATFDSGPANQSIAFGAIPNVRVGGSGTLVATASSGLPVAFGSLSPTTCGVAGSSVTGLAVGICTVAANQAGNNDFNPAPQSTLSFEIAAAPVPPGAPTITSIVAGSGRATLHFAAPANSGSSPIAGYSATCTANGQATRSATGSASPLTVRGLTGGVPYTCSVSATNGEGAGGGASAAMAVTPAPARNGVSSVMMLLLD